VSYQIAFRLLTMLDQVTGTEASAIRGVVKDLREHGLIPRGTRWRTADGDMWFGPPPDSPHDTIMIHMSSGQSRRRQWVERDCGPLEPLDTRLNLD
jgi:hypothetical protein